jgi:hypothetical protein
MASRRPNVNERTVPSVHGILARAGDPINGGQSLFAILPRFALIVGARRWIGAYYQKIIACLQALMPGSRRKDGDVTRFEVESASVAATKPHLTTSPRDAKDFMDARMVMDIVIDAVAP